MTNYIKKAANIPTIALIIHSHKPSFVQSTIYSVTLKGETTKFQTKVRPGHVMTVMNILCEDEKEF